MNLVGNLAQKEKTFKIPLVLTPKQREIENSTARYKIVRSGRKFGKTTYAIYQSIKWLGKPNSQVWYLSATYKQAKLIAWQEFKHLIPQEALKRKPNDTDLTITLKNGSELYLIGTDEMDALRGLKPTAVIFEEAAMHKREVWHEIVRPNLLVHKAPALFISTPKGFNWFKDLEDAARASLERGETEWAIFHYTAYDNPYIDKAELEKDKRDCDNEAVWRQEYLAEYESSVGRVFNSFSELRHVSSVMMPGALMGAGRAIDWGMRDDTACLWGYPLNQKLYVYREHAENGLPASQQAQMIQNKTTDAETIERNIIGHDAEKQDAEMRGLTVKWHFANAGIRPLRAGSKDKRSNRGMLQELFRNDKIVIDKSCRKLIKQLYSYEWKDTVLEKPNDDGNDDLVDALHSLVELFQYEIFIDRKEEKMSMSEILRKIEAEKAKFCRFQLPGGDKTENGVELAGTGAGYIY